MFSKKRFWLGLVLGAIGASLIGSGVLILGQFSRGFDMSDEAFAYSLTLAGGTLERGWFFSYAYITAPIFELLGQQVLLMRALRLLVYVAVCQLLAITAWQLTTRLFREEHRARYKAAFVIAGLFGAIWGYVYLPPVISYNELSVWFSFMILAVLFTGAALPLSASPGRFALLGAVAALLLVGLTVSKLPSALGVVLVVAVFCLARIKSWRQWATLFGCFIITFGISAWVFDLLGVPVWSVAREGLLAVTTGEGAPGGYSTEGLLAEYLLHVQDGLIVMRGPIALFVLAVLLVYLSLRGRSMRTSALSLSALVAGSLTLVSTTWALVLGAGRGGAGNAFEIGHTVTYIATASLALAVLGWWTAPKENRISYLRVVISLVFIAGLSVVGTNNPITFQSYLAIVSFFLIATMAVVSVLTSISTKSRSSISTKTRVELASEQPRLVVGALVVVSSLAIACFSLSAVWQGTWSNPYRQIALAQQNSNVDIGILRGIRTDENTAAAAIQLPILAERLGATETPTTAWDNPGLVLFFNNSQFAQSWQIPRVTTSTDELLAACQRQPQTLIVLDDGSSELLLRGGDSNRFYRAVSACGAVYPEEYRSVASVKQRAPEFDIEVQLPRSVVKLVE